MRGKDRKVRPYGCFATTWGSGRRRRPQGGDARKTYHRLALRELKKPERLIDLAEHQQAQVRELETRSEQELAIAIQQCYRHILYPSRNRVGMSDVDLAHSAIDIHSTSEKPGAGHATDCAGATRSQQAEAVRRRAGFAHLWLRDRTPLKKGQITVLALRDEFRRDPACPS